MISRVKALFEDEGGPLTLALASLLLGVVIGITLTLIATDDAVPRHVKFYEDGSYGMWVDGRYFEGCAEGGLCDDN